MVGIIAGLASSTAGDSLMGSVSSAGSSGSNSCSGSDICTLDILAESNAGTATKLNSDQVAVSTIITPLLSNLYLVGIQPILTASIAPMLISCI